MEEIDHPKFDHDGASVREVHPGTRTKYAASRPVRRRPLNRA